MADFEKLYEKMDASRGVAAVKGQAGEEILRQILLSYQQLHDSVIVHSYKYPYASNRQGRVYPGNVLYSKEEGYYEITREGLEDEIDLTLITRHRIFIIEAKARAGRWDIFDDWSRQNGTMSDKSPVAQCEKHARHFYHTFFPLIPEGDPRYVIPMTIFVDRATITDSRDSASQASIVVGTANTLKRLIQEKNVPLAYDIDIDKLAANMRRKGSGSFYE